MAQVIDEMVVITWDDSLGRARAYEPKQGVALANRWNLEVEPEAGADNVGTIKSFEHRFNRHGISKIKARTDADTEFPLIVSKRSALVALLRGFCEYSSFIYSEETHVDVNRKYS